MTLQVEVTFTGETRKPENVAEVLIKIPQILDDVFCDDKLVPMWGLPENISHRSQLNNERSRQNPRGAVYPTFLSYQELEAPDLVGADKYFLRSATIQIMTILLNWLISGLAVFVTAYLLPGVKISGFTTALVVAVVLGVINAFIKPILIILTLPINILTLGLFTLVINVLLIILTTKLVPGFKVDGFWWALVFSIVLSLVNAFLHGLER